MQGQGAAERERGDLMVRSIGGKLHARSRLFNGADSVGSHHFAGAPKDRGQSANVANSEQHVGARLSKSDRGRKLVLTPAASELSSSGDLEEPCMPNSRAQLDPQVSDASQGRPRTGPHTFSEV